MNLSVRHPDAKVNKLKKNMVNYYVVNLKQYLIFLKKIFLKNKISEVYFYCNKLTYSKKYLNLNRKFFFLTILMKKGHKNNKKIKYRLNTKNKKISLTFKKVFC